MNTTGQQPHNKMVVEITYLRPYLDVDETGLIEVKFTKKTTILKLTSEQLEQMKDSHLLPETKSKHEKYNSLPKQKDLTLAGQHLKLTPQWYSPEDEEHKDIDEGISYNGITTQCPVIHYNILPTTITGTN